MRARTWAEAAAASFMVLVAVGDGIGLQEGGAAPKGGSGPLFRFVLVSDTHVQSPEPKPNSGLLTYPGSNERFSWFIKAMNQDPPDFLIGAGDLIHGERLDRLAPDCGFFRAMTKDLRCPLYPVPGNHEIIQREGDPRHEQAYREAFGGDRLNYTFEHGGFLFIALGNGGACSVRQEVSRARNAWLRKTLEDSPGIPKILACHIPLVPMREEAVLSEGFGFQSYITHDKELEDVVRASADTLIAVLSGHLHLSGSVERDGIHHIVGSGTGGYPHDFVSFEVHDDRIKVRFRSVPESLADKGTNIHGKPRYGKDFTDRGHPTPESYLRGTEKERAFDIKLPAKKQPRRDGRK